MKFEIHCAENGIQNPKNDSVCNEEVGGGD